DLPNELLPPHIEAQQPPVAGIRNPQGSLRVEPHAARIAKPAHAAVRLAQKVETLYALIALLRHKEEFPRRIYRDGLRPPEFACCVPRFPEQVDIASRRDALHPMIAAIRHVERT